MIHTFSELGMCAEVRCVHGTVLPGMAPFGKPIWRVSVWPLPTSMVTVVVGFDGTVAGQANQKGREIRPAQWVLLKQTQEPPCVCMCAACVNHVLVFIEHEMISPFPFFGTGGTVTLKFNFF